MRILLVGGAGLIGSAIRACLLSHGHEVAATTRGAQHAEPGLSWIKLDLRTTTAQDWLRHLDRIDAVVNCAGVLQDSPWDSTEATHHSGPAELFAACEQAGVARVIHFSAIGVDREAPTAFSRSKAAGDAALMATRLEWAILRPSVVVGRAAFGGSALFRGLAALPVLPRFEATGDLQIVQLDDVVATVAVLLEPTAPTRIQLELAGPDRLPFDEVIAAYRSWLGWRPARKMKTPAWLTNAIYRLGDFAGWLGWRPPIRSTAQKEIVRGAVGDPTPWMRLTGIRPRSLREALRAEPASVQERWFSRLYFLKPVVFAIFSLFWISTALVSLGPGWEIGVGLMHEGGVTGAPASLTVVAGALADLVIGVAIAFRRTTKPALYAAVVLSLVYVILGTILVPRLWSEPLGPMLKIWPVLALNFVAIAIAEDR